ncbi:hypothetical protein T07_2375 [Trichinella nelsoni]|uniref:Uncharacterized protein n=1 Tax=Trichinella nelsoni TaxID=6336 RepID=A0A0V0RAZ2_9BILA|nr:hypothetical protein T07_2375 [Trichinella nelsoni]
MLHMATTCHNSQRGLYHLVGSLCKSAQTTVSTISGIRTSGRFHCRIL